MTLPSFGFQMICTSACEPSSPKSSRTARRVSGFFLSGALVACFATGPPEAHAACTSKHCPDATAVAAVRARAAAECGCVLSESKGAYLECAKDVVSAAVDEGTLSKRCRSRLLRCERAGGCGEAVSGFTDSGGVRIHHVSMGEGPLVVMIHGFPDYWYTWRHQMAVLADDHQVVAIDTRGYNLSDQPAGIGQYFLPSLVNDVAAVIEEFDRVSATIVGHDWGAGIAWGVGLLRPDLVDGLVILSVPHPQAFQDELANNPDQAAASAYARLFQAEGSHLGLTAAGLAALASGGDDVELYVEAFERSDFEAMMNYYKANFPQAPYMENTAPIAKVPGPLLLIHGLADFALLASGHNDAWDYVDGDLTMLMLPGVGHWIQRDTPDTVSRAIADWLAR
jgi:pimeloyl-ACP methyl ester carboxylesterase